MKKSKLVIQAVTVGMALSAIACSKPAPEAKAPPVEAESAPVAAPAPEPAPVAEPAAPLATPLESTKERYVEGVAGGVMTHQIQLEAVVVSVDQEKREAVLRGPAGNEMTVKVGKEAVNFYQVAPGDRVDVLMARELVVYVSDDKAKGKAKTNEKEKTPDGTAVAGASAAQGQQPGAAVLASTKVTSKIRTLDPKARTAALVFEDGKEEVFNVRPDVDMKKYKVGQEVVFLVTDLLALQVRKL